MPGLVPRILLYHSRTIYSVSETRFHTPPIPEPVKASDGRYVPNRIESGAVMRRVSRDIYASETAGVRELLANEITAARAAKKLGADPRIEVTVVDDKVMVWGIDSLGMERRIFDDIYTVLGRSGNFDGATPGQFGFGRAAYVTVSDTMLLETHHRNGDRYAVRGVDGAGFEVGLPEPDITYGTRVTMLPREGFGVSAAENVVRDTALRCEIPITITTEKGTERLRTEPLEAPAEIFYTDHPDAEFSVGKWDGSGPARSYLCGMPIKFRYRGAHPMKVSVNIRDERKYPPTPDRERMTEAAEEAVSRLIDAEIDRRLKGFPDDIGGAMSHPDRRLAFEMHVGPPGMGKWVDVFTEDRPRSEVLGAVRGSPVLACRTFSRRHIGAVLKKYPDAAFVRRAQDGITTITAFMKARCMRPLPPRGGPARHVAVHTANGVVRVDPTRPPAGLTIYRVANGTELNREKSRLWRMPEDMNAALTIHDVDGAADIGELVADARGRTIYTSRGTMTCGELADSGERVMVTGRRAIVDGWEAGNPKPDGIAVWRDGSGADADAHGLLEWVTAAPVCRRMCIGDVSCCMLLEAYLRLESPVLKRALLKHGDLHTREFCDGFLALEGKGPAAPDRDCGACNPV